MRTFGVLAAAAVLIPAAPSTPALAQSPRWDYGFCDVFDGMETCYYDTRGQCEYSRAQDANAFRDAGLWITQCHPSDDPYGLGTEWQYEAGF
jgi:hypothetical protein